ncbi:hypothetical protein ACLBOM_12530 [Escherichia coli]
MKARIFSSDVPAQSADPGKTGEENGSCANDPALANPEPDVTRRWRKSVVMPSIPPVVLTIQTRGQQRPLLPVHLPVARWTLAQPPSTKR